MSVPRWLNWHRRLCGTPGRCRCGFRGFAEKDEENWEHGGRAERRCHPDSLPVVMERAGRRRERMNGQHFAGEHRACESPEAPPNEGDETLAHAPNPLVCFA